MSEDLEFELLKAAMGGINEYLKTIRGCNQFGSNAKASMPDKGTIEVYTHRGLFILTEK